VHGTADDAVPCADGEAMNALLQQSTLVRIEGGAHSFGATHPLRVPLHPHLERSIEATVQHFTRHLAPWSA
jgi:hypothetical protein